MINDKYKKCRLSLCNPYLSFKIYHSSFFIAAAAAFFGGAYEPKYEPFYVPAIWICGDSNIGFTICRFVPKLNTITKLRKEVE